MNHLWQRFLLASSLLVGLAIGVAATVFGYSNLATVDVHWSVLELRGIPLWTVAVVPIALILVAGTLYHWIDGLHHFTEHMRHRRRVHELEAEVARLRAHLDQVLEMPGHPGSEPAAMPAAEPAAKASLPPAELAEADLAMEGVEPAGSETPTETPAQAPISSESTSSPDGRKSGSDRKKRARLVLDPKPEPEAPPDHTIGADVEPALPVQEA